MTTQIIEIIENSDLWKNLNETCKSVYKKEGRTPSTEEYQALRNILIMKCMQSIPEVMEMMGKESYEKFNK